VALHLQPLKQAVLVAAPNGQLADHRGAQLLVVARQHQLQQAGPVAQHHGRACLGQLARLVDDRVPADAGSSQESCGQSNRWTRILEAAGILKTVASSMART
jgi:hypothetical protein